MARKQAKQPTDALDKYRADGLAEGSAIVVNVRSERYDVYVGRRHPTKPGEDGFFGNESDAQTLDGYIDQFLDRVLDEKGFQERVLALKGKRLGCWCYPRPCHAMVIACWANLEDSDRALVRKLHKKDKGKKPDQKESVWELSDWARDGKGL